MRSLTVAFLAFTAIAFAACSGTTTVYMTPVPGPTPTGQPSAATSTVSFNVIVPNISGSARRRPNVVVPSASLSVAIQLDSVNGASSPSVAPTTVNLSAATTGCEQSSTQLSCVINVSAPVGALIYTLTVYSAAGGAGTSLGAGNLAVTTITGATVVAPATLTGTVTKIAVFAGVAALGARAVVPITVQAEDAHGNTVLGTYTNPVTLSDTDASDQTSLSASATNITNGAVVVTLTYAGGAMSAPATIGASAADVSPSSVKPALFSPNQTYPSVDESSTSFTYTQSTMFGTNGPPVNGPNTSGGTYEANVMTGQSFGGVNNLVEVSGLYIASAGLPSSFTDAINFQDLVAYYAWTQQGAGTSLGLVGATSSTYFTLNCATPYSKQIIVPMAGNWDVRSGSAPCTASYSDPTGSTGDVALFTDGSYTDNYFGGGALTLSLVVNSDGSTAQSDESCGCGESSIIAVSVPRANAPTIPVTLQTFPGAIPAPGSTTTPSPEPTSVPNPWIAYGIPSGTIPNPLESDTFTVLGSIAALPSQCVIPSGLLGTNPTLTEADETVIIADPGMDFNQYYYAAQAIKHYYLDGVGEICNENVLTADTYDAGFNNYYLNIPTNPGYNTSIDSMVQTQWTYLTATTLTASSARRRDASAAFSIATYALAHAPMRQRFKWTDSRRRFAK